MYQGTQPMYYGHWQENYNAYQPAEYPQQYYYNNNHNYFNGHYSESVSSTSSMDSLNDPYYYSHQGVKVSQDQNYHKVSPDMVYYSHPVSPTYSPSRSPAYSPQPSTYSQHSPAYSQQSYSPQPPMYSPQSSAYSPQPNVFPQQLSTYPLQSTVYSQPPPSYSPEMSYITANSICPVHLINCVNTVPTSPTKPENNEKAEFQVGMKPSERLQWIRKEFPKQAPSPVKLSKAWGPVPPVKPLRRPRMSTIKK